MWVRGMEYEQTRDAWLTNPDEAVAYVEQTQCDCLAVAVGTSHGAYKGTPRLVLPFWKSSTAWFP